MPITSCVKTLNGAQYLCVNDEIIEGVAYITYLRDNAHYEDFAKRGYKLYSVSLFFGSNYLNDTSHSNVFSKGIFDDDIPDYSGFDRDVENILKVCPDAKIIPRVNVSPSRRWELNHPDELCECGTDEFPDSKRPCVASDIWANEVKKNLRLFISHIESMPYCDNIVGYQVAGGNTEEWIPNDMKGFIGKRTREKFKKLTESGQRPDTTESFYRFLSEIVANRICEFAEEIKRLTERRLVVGSFYGYTFELCERRFAHHALEILLNSDSVDFLCSPISYLTGRESGTCHGYMVPVGSVKLHDKLYFAENDVRTHLTKPFNDKPYFNAPIWFGPPEEKSIEILKMHHARNLLNGHAGWWFDMWGGWYSNDAYMNFMEKARILSKEFVGKDMSSSAELAVFVDENCFALIEGGEGGICSEVRRNLGICSVPFDVYLSSDFEKVKEKYKAYISVAPCNTPLSDSILSYSKEHEKPICVINKENFRNDSQYFRDFCKSAGVFIPVDRDAVVFENKQFIFVHTAEYGEYTVKTKDSDKLYNTYTNEISENKFYAEKGQSFLFLKGSFIDEN